MQVETWMSLQGEDLDDNDSGVKDASDMDSDVEERQIEVWSRSTHNLN